jgi:hypothetical protein
VPQEVGPTLAFENAQEGMGVKCDLEDDHSLAENLFGSSQIDFGRE